MSSSTAEIDEQIERLRKGGTLAENEVKALCDKVSIMIVSELSRLFSLWVDWINHDWSCCSHENCLHQNASGSCHCGCSTPHLCWTPMQDGHVSVRHTTSNMIYFL
jgi:hypothetical protein